MVFIIVLAIIKKYIYVEPAFQSIIVFIDFELSFTIIIYLKVKICFIIVINV